MSISSEVELLALTPLVQRLSQCACGHIATGEQYYAPVCDSCVQREGGALQFYVEYKFASMVRRHRNLLEGRV